MAEEHRLWEQASSEHADADRRRHAELTGLEPGGASARDGSVVESDEQ
jgi:hypothetical protein